jgi:integrase
MKNKTFEAISGGGNARSDDPFAIIGAAGVPSLADILLRVADDPALIERQKRDRTSHLRLVARALNKDTRDIPALPAWITKRLVDFHPTRLGLSTRTWANARSSLRKVIGTYAGIPSRPVEGPLLPAWEELLSTVEDRFVRMRIKRFGVFASASRLDPDAVGQETFAAFVSTLVDSGAVGSPYKAARHVVGAWNRCRTSVAGWPDIALTMVPTNARAYTLPLDTFPQGFQDDVARFLATRSAFDPLDDGAPTRPLRPSSVKSYAHVIRRAASLLVQAGTPIEAITSLADLTTLDAFKTIGRGMTTRSDYRSSSYVHITAASLIAIARHHVGRPQGEIDAMRKIAARLKPAHTGMSAKTQARLRQFDDPQAVEALIGLPQTLADKAARTADPVGAARLMMVAVAVEIELTTTLRVGNLVGLNIDEHLRFHGRGRGARCLIDLRSAIVKNHRDLAYELPPESTALLRRYLDGYRPAIAQPGNPFVFPGRVGGHREKTGFANLIRRTIFKTTGLVVNVHLFRAATTKIYLDANPGGHEVARRVLGHADLRMTMRHYVRGDSLAAARHFDETILRRRAKRRAS